MRDLGQLLDTVEAGIGAARAHLVALSASLERIAGELAVAPPGLSAPAVPAPAPLPVPTEAAAHGPAAAPMVLPPELEGHATLPPSRPGGEGTTEPAAEPAPAASAPEPEAEPEPEPAATAEPEPGPPAPPPPAPRRPASDAAHGAARLVAIEMAVAGDTREGVGRRLRQEFGIRDPASILDDAFGPDPGTSGRRTYGV